MRLKSCPYVRWVSLTLLCTVLSCHHGAGKSTHPQRAIDTTAIDGLVRGTGSGPGGPADPSGYKTTSKRSPPVRTATQCIYETDNQAELTTDEIAVFNPNAGVLFPGSLVAMKGVESGTLNSRNVLAVNRQPIAITIQDVATSGSAPMVTQTVEHPSFDAIEEARIKLIDKNKTPSSNFAYTLHEYYSLEQSLLSAGISAHWISGSASASLARNTSTYKTGLMLSFQQRFYTLTFQAPSRPSDFFEDIDAAQLKQTWSDVSTDPIGYIASVSYGRWVLLTAESTHTEKELKAALDASINSAGAGGSV